MTLENSSALPTLARISSVATPQTSSDATANEAGLRDAPGSSRGSSGWSLTEPTDGAVHGAPTDGPARHRGTTPRHSTTATAETIQAETVAFWEEQALRLDWAERPGSQAAGSPTSGKPWHTAHRRVAADVDAGTGPDIAWFEGGRLNVAYNCVDRHVAAGRGEKGGLPFEGGAGGRPAGTYAQPPRGGAKGAHAPPGPGNAQGARGG